MRVRVGARVWVRVRVRVGVRASNAGYLSRSVRYEGDNLLDTEDDAVMMQWEAPLMEAR